MIFFSLILAISGVAHGESAPPAKLTEGCVSALQALPGKSDEA